jgi:hypothetical protein
MLLFLGINQRARVNFEAIFKFKKSISRIRKINRIRGELKKCSVEKEALFNLKFLQKCE